VVDIKLLCHRLTSTTTTAVDNYLFIAWQSIYMQTDFAFRDKLTADSTYLSLVRLSYIQQEEIVSTV
jgi:hypothetical protein